MTDKAEVRQNGETQLTIEEHTKCKSADAKRRRKQVWAGGGQGSNIRLFSYGCCM